MQNKKFIFLIISMLTVLILFGQAFGQNTNITLIKPSNSFSAKDVEIRLVPEKKKFLDSKRIPVRIYVTNKNSQQTVFRYFFNFATAGFRLEVKNSRREIIPSTKSPYPQNAGYSSERSEMPPFYREGVNVELTKYYDLPAGKYYVTAKADFISYVTNSQKTYVEKIVTSRPTSFIIVSH